MSKLNRLFLSAALLALGSVAGTRALTVDVPAGPFHNCGLRGKTAVARVGDLNVLKNRAADPARINAAITADALLAPGDDTDRFSTDDGAEIEAFVVNVKPGGRESVNCAATDPTWKDTHIELGLTPEARPNARIVVEVTPRWRAAMAAAGTDWSTPALKTLIGKKVRVRGWVFFDAEHTNASENTHPGDAHNWRGTARELHPVTAIEAIP